MTSAEIIALSIVAAVASTVGAFIAGVAYWKSSCRSEPCCDLKMRSRPSSATEPTEIASSEAAVAV